MSLLSGELTEDMTVEYLNKFKVDVVTVPGKQAAKRGLTGTEAVFETAWKEHKGLLVVKPGPGGYGYVCDGIITYDDGATKLLESQVWKMHAVKSFLFWMRNPKKAK